MNYNEVSDWHSKVYEITTLEGRLFQVESAYGKPYRKNPG